MTIFILVHPELQYILFSYMKPLGAECGQVGMVCCRNDRFYNKPLSESGDENDNKDPKPAFEPECGKRNDLRELRFSDGDLDRTLTGEWPHMCTIWKATYATSRNHRVIRKEYVCGASLISNDTVLTTAHNIQ